MATVADAMEWVWTGGNWEAMPFIATWREAECPVPNTNDNEHHPNLKKGSAYL